MTTSEGRRGLERTISHTSTRVSTSAKVAARKIRGGRVRGMKVLAHMNTPRWSSMSTTDREEATQCPCECGMQNVEHVVSECEYTVVYLDEMVDTVDYALQSEPEAAQRKWLGARNMGEKVAGGYHRHGDERSVTGCVGRSGGKPQVAGQESGDSAAHCEQSG